MHAPLRSFPVLETRRLLLREIVSADAPDLLRLLSDPDVVRYYDMRLMQSLSEVHAMIARHQYRFEHDEGIRWGIALKQQPHTVIGLCGLFWEWHKQRGELSYALAKPFWSQGLMTEALSTMIPYVLDSWTFIERLEAFIVDANIGSQRVLQKLGFRREFYSRTRIFVDSQFHNEHLYVLHRSGANKAMHW
jgi:[ribosomal protein S5]-alanine N-acetyltransferase